MSVLADLLGSIFERSTLRLARADNDERALRELVEALLTEQAEVTGMALAGQILDRYATMDDVAKRDFFAMLARDMDVNPDQVRAALATYENEPGKVSYRAFWAAVEPRRQELIRRLNQVPGATQRLVAMRADLLRLTGRDPAFAALDLDFQHLFLSWFNRGFLVLRPISWETPAHILEKIIAYEAVHAIDSWDDLRRRVQPEDRRCFAFFHPAMPREPLIFVEVALTRGIPGSVQRLLSEEREPIDATRSDTAVFYSISNCQAGLAGISFGNSLIKQVVADLSRELPGLKTFVTLSPIPGLAAWMAEQGYAVPGSDEALAGLAALYLTEARQSDNSPRDPVARFHLGNGASIHAVHTAADTSPSGLARSHGAMVNYLYDLSRLNQNTQGYAEHRTIAAAAAVRTLARQARKDLAPKETDHGQSAL